MEIWCRNSWPLGLCHPVASFWQHLECWWQSIMHIVWACCSILDFLPSHRASYAWLVSHTSFAFVFSNCSKVGWSCLHLPSEIVARLFDHICICLLKLVSWLIMHAFAFWNCSKASWSFVHFPFEIIANLVSHISFAFAFLNCIKSSCFCLHLPFRIVSSLVDLFAFALCKCSKADWSCSKKYFGNYI